VNFREERRVQRRGAADERTRGAEELERTYGGGQCRELDTHGQGFPYNNLATPTGKISYCYMKSAGNWAFRSVDPHSSNLWNLWRADRIRRRREEGEVGGDVGDVVLEGLDFFSRLLRSLEVRVGTERRNGQGGRVSARKGAYSLSSLPITLAGDNWS
jgi:hypothetical protein